MHLIIIFGMLQWLLSSTFISVAYEAGKSDNETIWNQTMIGNSFAALALILLDAIAIY